MFMLKQPTIATGSSSLDHGVCILVIPFTASYPYYTAKLPWGCSFQRVFTERIT